MATSTFERPLVVANEESQKKLFKIINTNNVNERISKFSPFKEDEKEEKLLKQFASHYAL